MFRSRLNIVVVICFLILIHNHVDLIAQTGPGGVGSSATNVLWLSADNQVYNNAGTTLASTTDNVQQWNDLSGNSNHAVQSVVGSRPNYITNILNGLPILRFSAGNDHMMSTGVSTANVASVWAVVAYSSLPSSNPGILIGAPAATGTNVGAGSKTIGMWVNSGGGTRIWGRGIQSNGTIRDISQVTTLNASTFYIINNIYRAATSINQFVNNSAAGNNTSHNGTLSSWTDITIGRQGNESWNGDIAEIIFYNTEVNSAERIVIDNYLSAKYGLSLSSNDIYDKDNVANGNYDFEVAGIGRVDASNITSSAQGTGIVRILNPSGLGNDEFLLWGHDNGSTQATNLTDVPAGVQGRMARVWRVSEANSSSASVDVGSIDMRFDLSGLGAITASDLRLLVDTDNDGIFADEAGISGATLVSGNIYEFAGVTAITNNVRFTLGTINKSQTPLPIELLGISAVLNSNKQVEINWSTATEKNNKYFEIEKSVDGENWEIVQEVKGSGTTSKKHTYQVIDPYPYTSVSYYRIKQLDFDDSYSYSPIVSIDLSREGLNTVHLYPNPTNGQITIQGEASELSDFHLYDQLGRDKTSTLIVTQINSRKLILDLSALNSGIYYFRSTTQVF